MDFDYHHPYNDVCDFLKKTIDPFFLSHKYMGIGFSTGPDSSFLLRLMCDLGYKDRLIAIHCDHGLRPESLYESAHALKICTGFGVPLVVIVFDPSTRGQTNTYVWARKQRLAAFSWLCSLYGLSGVFLGHHFDDAVENMILRAPKRNGVYSPHPSVGVLKSDCIVEKVRLLRPLLALRKKVISHWIDHWKMSVSMDPWNEDSRYARGRLRKGKIAASFSSLSPQTYLSQTATASPHAEYLAWCQQRLIFRDSSRQFRICLKSKQWTGDELRRAMMYGLEALRGCFIMPSWSLSQRILFPKKEQAVSYQSLGLWQSLSLWRTKTSLVLWNDNGLDTDRMVHRHFTQDWYLPGPSIVECITGQPLFLMVYARGATQVNTFNHSHARFQVYGAEGLSFRHPRPYDRVSLSSGNHLRISHLFTNEKVPPWLRGLSCLCVTFDDRVIAVECGWGGRWRVSSSFYVKNGDDVLSLSRIPFISRISEL